MPEQSDEIYLGDGLYASYDGFMITLRAPRENGDHWVALEPFVLIDFFKFVHKRDILRADWVRNLFKDKEPRDA